MRFAQFFNLFWNAGKARGSPLRPFGNILLKTNSQITKSKEQRPEERAGRVITLATMAFSWRTVNLGRWRGCLSIKTHRFDFGSRFKSDTKSSTMDFGDKCFSTTKTRWAP